MKTRIAQLLILMAMWCSSAGAVAKNAQTITKAKEKNTLATSDPLILRPDGGMQMWYYRCARNFRYAIPTDFEFAYINTKGKVVITGPFIKAGDFHGGVTEVNIGNYILQNGKWTCALTPQHEGQKALLHTDGELAKLRGCNLRQPFFDDLALAVVEAADGGGSLAGQVYELIDKNGKIKTSCKWPDADKYSEGLLVIKTKNQYVYGYADKNNNVVIPPKFTAAERFSEGLACVQLEQTSPMSMALKRREDPAFNHPGVFSYIDKKGSVVIPGPFMEARPFTGGLAAVMQDGKWGYIDKQGKVVVPFDYDWAGDFTGNLAPVEKAERVGYIDKSGKHVIDFKYRDGREFSGGLAPITIDSKRWGYIDEAGKEVIPPQFQRAFPFNDGLALVYIDTRKEINPSRTDAPYLFISAMSLRNKGRLNAARTACKTILKVAPGTVTAGKAENMLKCALPDHDLKPEVEKLVIEGLNYATQRKLADAEKCFKEALEKDPECFSLTGSLANIYNQTDRRQQALDDLHKAIEKRPSYARGYYWLYQVYKAMGEKQKALENFEIGRKLDPDDSYFDP